MKRLMVRFESCWKSITCYYASENCDFSTVELAIDGGLAASWWRRAGAVVEALFRRGDGVTGEGVARSGEGAAGGGSAREGMWWR